ncbi:MAG: adenine phosphoribosyltransferase, partial [Solirubrobacteraceae bacterium]
MASAIDLEAFVRAIPDFPMAGILFRDITPLLADAAALDAAISRLAAPFEPGGPQGIDFVLAAEARGFILGAALARQLDAGFLPARKPGRLPARTIRAAYQLEYGVDSLE